MGASGTIATPEAWGQLSGEVVGGDFRLGQCLGTSDHSAVFLTQRGDRAKLAIKLVPAPQTPADADLILSRWELAASLSHPNLLLLFERGRCRLQNRDFLYLVTEFADEDLSQILPERALSTAEARQMLSAALDALDWLLGKDLVHGHIRPSNVMAAGDVLKLSSDSLCPAGSSKLVLPPSVYDAPELAAGTLSPAADMWSVGMLLVEVFRQRLPAWDRDKGGEPQLPPNMPEPFGEIARNCLRRDPAQRWTTAVIRTHLAPAPSKPAAEGAASRQPVSAARPSEQGKGSARRFGIAIAVGVLVLAAVLAILKFSGRNEEGPKVAPRQNATTAPAQSEQTSPSARTPGETHEPGIVHRAEPDVSPRARQTIRGTIRVVVRVQVDGAGNVTEARLESPGPSRYFARVAVESAHSWKFAAAKSPSEWRLVFGFRRDGTRVTPAEVKR